MRWLAGFILLMAASAAHAGAPERSHRPEMRALVQPISVLRPVMRKAPRADLRPDPALIQAALNGTLAMRFSAQAAARSLRPSARPPEVMERVMAKKRARRRGAICGDLDIQGERVGFVPGRIKGCGIKDAVKVRSVAGVGLTQQALIDCPTAKALKTWVERSAKPALSRQGGGLDRIKVAAHYACRTRNNRPGAKLSEHGKGRAIDISGFYLKNGDLKTVLQHWNTPGTKAAMRKMHNGACGPFGTVLGPNADRFHRDHFHFDTARYRSGPYCR